MASDPDGSYDAFSPMPAAERERLLVEWNNTAEDYSRAESIHGLFEKCAEAHPLKTAIVSNNEKWTYRDLNRRANDVAGTFIELDAGPGSLVGICMERGA